MKNTVVSILIIWIFVCSSLVGIFYFLPKDTTVSAITITVDDDGPADYSSIQDAINSASDGDTVYVYNGTYNENVVVNRTINLTGEDKNSTIIFGDGSDDVVHVTSDWVNITEFTVIGSLMVFEKAGIKLDFVKFCRIYNNNISDGWFGIFLYGSKYNVIEGNNASDNWCGIYLDHPWTIWNNITENIVSSNFWSGIFLDGVMNNNVTGNIIYSNIYDAISLTGCMNMKISGNIMNENGIYIQGFGPTMWHYNSHEIDTSNLINGKPVYYFKDKTGGTIPPGAGQVILGNCTDIIIENQYLTNGTVGIQLGFSSNNHIFNNNISYNRRFGVLLHYSDNNTLDDNNVSNNNYFVPVDATIGICLYFSNNNDLARNNISSNDWGLYLYSSNYNNISQNDASSNDLYGISLYSSNENNITENNALNNVYGVYLWYSDGNNITGNNASNNEDGIYIRESDGTGITDNVLSKNVYGIYINYSSGNNITYNNASLNTNYGIFLDYSDGNNITGNTAYNNSHGIYLWISSQNNITDNIASGNDWCGIDLRYSDWNNIIDNNASENVIGIRLYESIGNNITKNLAFLNIWHGIIISYSEGNKVTRNNASFNDESGIYISGSFTNIVVNNFAFSNLYGIWLHSSSGNLIFGNNVSSNNRVGIELSTSLKNNIFGNNATSNGQSGIELIYSNSNNIKDNEVSNNSMGIVLESSNENNITGNIALFKNLYGLGIYYSNGNNITGNYASNSSAGIVLYTSIGNNITKNNMSNNVVGIFLDNANGNNITDNNASNNAGGISLSESSNNTIVGNNASSNSDDGIHLVDSNDNNVLGNIVIQNNIEGIHLMNSCGNTITNNFASDNDMGIYLFQSSGNYIIGNNVSKSIDGIRLSFSTGNEIIGNNATLNNVAGIYLRASNWNTITRNNAHSNNVNGILLDLSSNNTINNCNMYSNNFYGVGAREDAQDNYIINSTISNSGSYDFNLYDNSSIIAINTTFNKTKVYFDDPNSTLTVQWYMHIYVVSTYSLPISGAAINITNITDVSIQSSPFITENDGFARWIVVTDYIQSDTNGGSPGGDNKVYHTPHNVTAILNGITGYAEPEPVMDSSKVITIILDIEKPIADAGMDASVDEDEIYMFDGSGSVDNIGMRNWTWDFGDGIFGYGETPTHIYTSSGFYVVVLNVTDTSSNWNIDTVNILVNNVPPIADASNDKIGDEGEQIYFDGSNSIDTSSDIDSLIYTWDFGDGTVGTGKMVNHSYEDNGTYTVTLQVTDDDGSTSVDSITVTINNIAPKITPITPQFLQEDQIYTLQVIVTDVKGDTLIFSDNTTMFDIDLITGVISFTPTNADVGVHLVNITVADDDGAESYIEIQIDVQNTNDAPIITSSPITIAVENSTYYYNLTVVDEDLDSITYMLDLKPDGMNIDTNGRIAWTPTYQQASQIFMVIVNVSDGNDFNTQTFSITVMNVNDKPIITSTPVLTGAENVLYTYDVDAAEVDMGDKLIYSLDTAPLGMSIDSFTGLITWIPTNDQVGNNHVIVNVTDSANTFVTQEFTIIVANSNDAPVLEEIGPQVATEGVTFSYNVRAVDIDVGDSLTFSDDSDLFDINSTTGNITFVPSNDDVGIYTIKVMVTDSYGAIAFESVLFIVNNVNNPPTLPVIGTQILTEDVPFTLVVIATDIDLSDTLIFMDNTTLFDINPNTGEISFMPTNEDVGTYLVNISVKDESGSIAYQTVNFTVNNVNDPPLIGQIEGLTVVAGKPFSYTIGATDVDHGDTLTFSDDTEIFDIDSNTGEISFTPSGKDAGVHYVTITVTDEEGVITQTTVTFTILEAEAEEPFDYTWILLIIIVGLIAFLVGYYMKGREETEPPKEEQGKDLEPEEVEMELLEEEPKEEERVEEFEKAPPPPPPPEKEGIPEFEPIEDEGKAYKNEETEIEEIDDSQKD